MQISALARIFVVERHRQRAGDVGFSVPAFSEVDLDPTSEPLLATNMRNTFLRTRVSSQSVARYGYSECSLEDEHNLLHEFFRVLSAAIQHEGWSNRASSVEEGLEVMRSLGYAPMFLVTSGSMGTEHSVEVLSIALPGGAALISTSPNQTGYYTRIGGNVGVLAQRVDRTFVVVE